jgi:hypothetical protein
VSNRSRAEADNIDQHIGIRTRSKMGKVNNSTVQNLFSPLHDEILFQGNVKFQAQDLQLGVLECKIYHNFFMNTKVQINFDRLLQLPISDKNEEYK